MYVKVTLITSALYIHLISKYVVKSEYVDILLPFNESGNIYTRFINVTEQHFLWLYSVMCDNQTYEYSINYNSISGSVDSNSSKTFVEEKIQDPANYQKEYSCTSMSSIFSCVRIKDMQVCDINKIAWIFLDADISLTCSEKCVSMCPSSPIEDIVFINQTQPLKHNNAVCENSKFYQTSTSKPESTFPPTYSTKVTLISASTALSKESTVSTVISKSTFLSTDFVSSSLGSVKDTSHDDYLPVILGASIGGGLGLIMMIIIIIVLVVCIRKRRQRAQKRKSEQAENNQDFAKENNLRNQLQHQTIDGRGQKTKTTVLTKAEDAEGLNKRKDWTQILDIHNLNADNVPYSGIDVDSANITVTNDDASNENQNHSRHPPRVFSNPVFGGLGANYSSIQDIRNKRKNNVNNVGHVSNNETAKYNVGHVSNNEAAKDKLYNSTYSKLGENIRSFSDTYSVLPVRISGNEVLKSLGQNSGDDENKESICNKNIGDIDGPVNCASEDVYAEVNKSLRQTP